jgi:hypothetical protein
MTQFWDPGLTQKRALIKQGYANQQADQTWQTRNIKQQHATSFQALKSQYAQQRASLPGQYAGRGLLNSGIYKQGLIDYNKGRTTAFKGLAQQYASQQHQLQAGGAKAQLDMNQSLNDVDLAEAQARAQLAAQLKAVA